MEHANRPLAFWIITGFLAVSMILLLMGQTMALIDYELAVEFGLQEDIRDVSSYGVQVNRAFGAGDTMVYIPLIALSIIGLVLRKRWSLLTTAAVMGVSMYWATTVVFMLVFLAGTPGYHLEPGLAYWFITAAYMVFGAWGLLYLVFRGDNLLT
jgi:hypothetical protein